MSNLYTFTGGVRIPIGANEKRAGLSPVSVLPLPSLVRIDTKGQAGLAVSVGDSVCTGQRLSTEDSANPVCASISGKVVQIVCSDGGAPQAVIIESDGNDTPDPSLCAFDQKLSEISPADIVARIRNAGITESVDGSFVARRIESALGGAKRFFINCTECEPFLASRHRLILERPSDVLNGAKILLRALELSFADIIVEDSRMDVIRTLEKAIGKNPMLRIRVCRTKHPQGDKRLVINSVTVKEVPVRESTAQLGYLVLNAEVCADIFRAFSSGMPAIERDITVAGDCIAQEKVVRARIGTPIEDIISACGGLKNEPAVIIGDSVMNGREIDKNEYYLGKSDTALLFLSEKYIRTPGAEACIRCGKCADNCPMHLLPLYLAKFAKKGNIKGALAMGLKRCIECGTCTYNCPGGVEHIKHIRKAKELYNADREREDGNE